MSELLSVGVFMVLFIYLFLLECKSLEKIVQPIRGRVENKIYVLPIAITHY